MSSYITGANLTVDGGTNAGALKNYCLRMATGADSSRSTREQEQRGALPRVLQHTMLPPLVRFSEHSSIPGCESNGVLELMKIGPEISQDHLRRPRVDSGISVPRCNITRLKD